MEQPQPQKADRSDRPRLAPRRTPTGPRGRERVERILTATEGLLARQSASEITAAAIVEAAGISIGSFYQYFANAPDAVGAVLHRRGEQIDRVTISVIEASAELPWREAIDRIIDSVFENFGSLYDDASAQAVSRSVVPSPEFQRLADESTARVTRALHAHPELVKALPDARQRWLVSRTTIEACTGIQGWAFRAEADDYPAAPEAVAQEMKNLVKAYLARYLEDSR